MTTDEDNGDQISVGDIKGSKGVAIGRDAVVNIFEGVTPPPIGPAIPRPKAGEEYVERQVTKELREALLRGEQAGLRGAAGVAGLGGVGKTELAIRLAIELQNEFEGGVIWVELKERATDDVLRDMAAQLGLALDPRLDTSGIARQVRMALGAKERLVVLDDVREAHAPDMQKYLLPPPKCALLVTTRLRELPGLGASAVRALDIFEPGEAERMMRGILGDEACDAEPDALKRVCELCGYLALALNVSARLIKRDADPRRGIDRPVAAQVARLEGARGRLEALELPEAELSVRAALKASYDELEAEEQRRYARLGVFAGPSFLLLAVVPLWYPDMWDADETTLKAQWEDTEAFLERLCNLSMLDPAGPGHYQMHDLWRDFAQRELEESGDVHAARHAHARFFATFALRFEDINDTRFLAYELPDLSAAADFAREHDADLLFRLAWHTRNTLYFAGLWGLSGEWLQAALEALGEAEDRDIRQRRVALQSGLAQLAIWRGDRDEAERLLAEALPTCEKLGDRLGAAVSRDQLAELAAWCGDWNEAKQLQQAALTAYEEFGDLRNVAISQAKLAALAIMRGEPNALVKAEQLAQASLKTAKKAGDPYSITNAHDMLADLAMLRSEWHKAERLYREVLAANVESGNWHGVASVGGKLAYVLIATDRRDAGCTMLAESVAAMHKLGAHHIAGQMETEFTELCIEDSPPTGAVGISIIVDKTIAALTGKPENKQEWFVAVHRKRARVEAAGNAQAAALMGAVEKLLLGDDPATLKPPLEGPYKITWERIVEGLKSS